MLSRVAAAKAPRAHNRRRVTGSSGRRREGRESEPQRLNMSRRVFNSALLLLLLVVMMCCNAVGDQQADAPAPGPGSSPENHFVWRNKKEEEKVGSLYFPSLLEVNGKVFAVAKAQCTENDKVFTGIASKLLTLDKSQTKEELDASKVKTQVLVECPSDKAECASQPEDHAVSQSETKVIVNRPTTVVKENDIYMLVGNYSSADDASSHETASDAAILELLLVKGKVGGESSDSIIWGDTSGVPCISTVEKEKVALTRLIGGGGSGIKMHDDTLVFPVEGTSKKEGEATNDEKAVSLLIYSSDNAGGWKLSKEVPHSGCGDPSVVEWGKEDKKLMMMTACDDGRRRVYESGDKGESWTEALGTISRVWGNKQGEGGVRSGFITATIDGVDDNRNVMLVTLPVYPEEDSNKETGNGKGVLHLWLTDNTHIVDIGPVSEMDDAAASSLLYKSAESGDNNEKEELIALYEKKKDGGKTSHSLWSVPLTAQLQRVKDVLATWKKADDIVSKLCPSKSDVDDASTATACNTVKITDGLVGFLSGNFSENTWRDEYLGVNATVKKKDGAEPAENGVTFKGRGAWAEWPVGSQGENQPYHFANYNFTLVATVSIHGVPTSVSVPVMGVRLSREGNKKTFELSYDKEKKWQVLCGSGNPEDQSRTLATNTTHHVVILLRNGTQGSAYVDGKRVGGNEACALENTDLEGISHFYIGGDGGAKGDAGSQEGVSVTVMNVLLYNRPLNDDEITALNTKLSIPKARGAKTVEGTPPVASKQATPEAETPSSLGGQQQTEQDSLRTSENAGSGVLSTSAASTAKNSPAANKSENQSASGTYPEGHPNVDVDSSSEGGQTVDAEAGDTVQGDETQQPSVGTSATADTNAPTAETMAPDGTAVAPEVGAHSGENGETAGGTNGQEKEDIHARDGEVKAAALNSSLGNVSQGNNSDAGTVRGSGLLPSLLLLLGLWGLAAL
ncbi:putative trans-sialidase, Group VI [Trypanosoma cruzi]|uniref:Trans-sialidase, putative n=2 Tax=Trypanosoma cruzi TaxID=5693 RepID=Q4E0Z9_TRYCC|nr:trans-sialidase, putative [Trypanosoma cruzi]EAN98456.1 trans-sialidase, putative [Trypanosoma cruzi]PWV12273.1 putative trans-sialidase, Group VI [Trypanosoma cruzi]RNC34077.1 trans-sialidase [Trypanosoma cruzi]|eukprot:XP_820307.1 trans-sialidase [Trypanosoma cruzi strain CL Brener]